MDEEYRDLLLAAERRYRKSWKAWFDQVVFVSFRILAVMTAKSTFMARDALSVVLNGLYSLLLIPFDAILVIVYFLAVNVYPDPTDNPDDLRYDVHKAAKRESASSMADLNVLRRLFWAGEQVAVSRNMRCFCLPKTVVTLEPSDTVTQNWINRIPPYGVQKQSDLTANVGLLHLLTSQTDNNNNNNNRDSDELPVPEPEPQQPDRSKWLHYPGSLTDWKPLLYFLTRPTDTTALTRYSKQLASR